MKTVIVSINSKYIHAPLAPWYLKEACRGVADIEVLIHSINEELSSIYMDILSREADVVMFSCYIWNIEYVKKLSSDIWKADNNVKIVWGGPEVSFDCAKILSENEYVDVIVSGEGEEALPAFFKGDYSNLCYRDNKGDVVDNSKYMKVENLDSIRSPYTEEMLSKSRGKIMYYESSRGCPFDCSYCLSSAFDKVRCFSMDRIKEDISKIVNAGFKQIKFVDRTFNCIKSRAVEILEFLINETGDCTFHFEIAADILGEKFIRILNTAPIGKVQIEAGVQTLNEKTLEEIDRVTDISKLKENVAKTLSMCNVHVHLDLIAGLPYEDFESFKDSFNGVYRLEPHDLQLGFLKVLKGTKIEKRAKEYGIVYREYAPYEIISSKWISAKELNILKGVESALERLYNSSRLLLTLEYLMYKYYESAFDFYFDFSEYADELENISLNSLFQKVYEFMERFNDETIDELIRVDYLSSTISKKLPDFFSSEVSKQFRSECFEFLKDEKNILEYLPRLTGMSTKEIYKLVHFEKIGDKVFLFDHSDKNIITDRYSYTPLKKWPFV